MIPGSRKKRSSPEPAGKHREPIKHGSTILDRISSDFPVVSGGKEKEVDRKSLEKSGQFRLGILLPRSIDFRRFPDGTDLYATPGYL